MGTNNRTNAGALGPGRIVIFDYNTIGSPTKRFTIRQDENEVLH